MISNLKVRAGAATILEQPKRLNQLVYHALAEDLVSEAKAAELLGIKVVKLRARRRMEVSDEADRH